MVVVQTLLYRFYFDYTDTDAQRHILHTKYNNQPIETVCSSNTCSAVARSWEIMCACNAYLIPVQNLFTMRARTCVSMHI